MTRTTIAALLVSAIVSGGTPASAASLFDPALRFRQLPTEHFVIYFHQGEERTAQRLATIAEDTWRALRQPLGVVPPARTRVVLADQTELWNGYATPLPRDTIVIYAVWPAGRELEFDDWLRLAFTHEFTHIVHLDRSEGWARGLRAVFGRTQYAFPNLFLPVWQIEGLATYEESVITGEGRLHAGDFRAIVREAAAAHRLEPLDRVNGGLTDWPGAAAVYAYGLDFHAYLADRFGANTLGSLADVTSRSLPYFGSLAFKRVYGEPLGALWHDYETAASAAPRSGDSDPAVTRLTFQGFTVSGPRFDRPCATCPMEVVYAASDADRFPGLYAIPVQGGVPRRLTRRYLGSTTGIGTDTLYFDQVDIHRNVGTYSDLYAYTRATGRVRRLSDGARLLDPDLSPNGDTIACVQDRPGQRDVVLIDVRQTAARHTLLSEQDTYFNAPRWSPDGRALAIERHRREFPPDVVIVDLATRSIVAAVSDARARIVTPAWLPDDSGIVAAVAQPDETFNIFEFALDGSRGRQITHTTGGATWPDVSADGSTLAFVGYTPDGYDLFAMPYPDALGPAWRPVPAVQRPAPDVVVDRPFRTYEPWSTLLPTSWSPVVDAGGDQVRIGAAISGFDVLGYHGYAASATWAASTPDGAPLTSRAKPDWQVDYLYTRWQPTIIASASAQTSFFAGPATDAGTPSASTVVAHQIEAGVILPLLHVRLSHQASASFLRERDDFTLISDTFSRTRAAVRAGWLSSSARTYGYSISPEGGITAGVTAEFVRQGLGAFADANVITEDARLYLPGLAPHHVVAFRVAAGVSTGDVGAGRTFLLGGSSPNQSTVDYGRQAISLLRGFSSDSFAGSHVALVNAEYRWPIARPQRGVGTWPLFLHTVHAAVFVDAGHAWTNSFRAADAKTSVGAELSTNFVGGYTNPFTATVGAAWGHDGSGLLHDRASIYVRIGRAF